MKKTGIWLIIAAFLVLIGGMIFTVAMMGVNWDFSSLRGSYETRTVQIEEAFRDISVMTNTADISVLPSEDGTCKAVFQDSKKEWHSVSVEEGTLFVKANISNDPKDVISYLVGSRTPKISLYLPEKEYNMLFIEEHTGDIAISEDFSFEKIDIQVTTGDVSCNASSRGPVSIVTSTGDISVERTSAKEYSLAVSTGKIRMDSVAAEEDVSIAVSTGRIELNGISAGNFLSGGGTGKIFLENVICREKISIERSTGDVTLKECDAAELEIKTGTGDVEGTLLSEKVFVVKTNTGKIEVPETVTGGKCKITTTTGDIRITFK